MSIEHELQGFVSQELLADASDELVGLDEPLITSGRVDSMGLMRIVSYIQERHGVDVLSSCGPDDFNTISALAAAIERALQSD